MADYSDKIEQVLQAVELKEQDARLMSGQAFPALEFLDENGGSVRPRDVGPGPLLLVFFRGFW